MRVKRIVVGGSGRWFGVAVVWCVVLMWLWPGPTRCLGAVEVWLVCSVGCDSSGGFFVLFKSVSSSERIARPARVEK